MIWTICLVASILVLAATASGGYVMQKKSDSSGWISTFQAVLAGIFLAVWIAVVPVLVTMFQDTSVWQLYALFLSIIQTLQIFTINVGADFILDTIGQAPEAVSTIYSCYMTLLFVSAPVLTVSSVALMFSNVATRLIYLLQYRCDVFVFSALNEKSLLLAQSIRQNHKDALILFTGIDRKSVV